MQTNIKLIDSIYIHTVTN